MAIRKKFDFVDNKGNRGHNGVVDTGDTIFRRRFETVTENQQLTDNDTGGVFFISASVDVTLPRPVDISDGWNASFILTNGNSAAATIVTSSETPGGHSIQGSTTSGDHGTGGTITFAAGKPEINSRVNIEYFNNIYYVQGFTTSSGGITVS